MNTINQTDTILKKIEAKQTLGLPLTARETALLTLYGTTEREQAAGNIADEESARKARFVAEYLSPLLQAADIRVANAKYWRDPETSEEIVTITHNSGYTRERCVTADSLIALTFDTIKGL